MNLKVSVIVPVYNVEKYLERCVHSILNQTHTNLEIVLVNDGSKDSSGTICDAFEKKDSRIKVVHQKNGGLSAARNTGLNHATGDFIAFIDSDDWIELDMFEIMLNYAFKHELDIIECDIQYTSKEKIKTDPTFFIENKEDAAIRIIENRFFSVCRRIYSFDIIKNMRFIENYIYEDMLFTSELIRSIEKVGYIKKPFYNYFIENDTSIMHGSYNMRNVNSIDTIEKFETNIKKHFSNKKIIKAAENYVLFFSVHNYQKLFENKNLDKKQKYRKELKRKIIKNYDSNSNNNFYTKMARFSPMWFYNIFCYVNHQRIKRISI